MKSKQLGIALIAAILCTWLVLYATGANNYLSLRSLQSAQTRLLSEFESHFVLCTIAYVSLYVFLTAISFPGATGLSLIGGMIFGLVTGTVVVLVSATLGAIGAFLITRVFLGEWVRERHLKNFKRLDDGIREEGSFYLFALRLNPVIPFFLINSLSGLTQIRLWPFAWISFVGMLPGTVLYVNAGTQIAKLKSFQDILSPTFLASSIALGFAPLLFKKLLARKAL